MLGNPRVRPAISHHAASPDTSPNLDQGSLPTSPAANDDPRTFELIDTGFGSIQLEMMIYARATPGLRPLLVLNSIEFPMPPSVKFCEEMKQNGLQVIFLRRLGFGQTPSLPSIMLTKENIANGAAVMTEVSIIYQAITKMGWRDIVLLGIGSANPVCYRLGQMHPEISLSIFSNAVLNQDSWEGFRPIWFQAVLKQTVLTKSGFRIASSGLKFYLKNNPISFFNQLLEKSTTDRKYLKDNAADFIEASHVMRDVKAETFFYDLTMAMSEDRFLKDGLFSGSSAVLLAIPETNPEWLERTKEEAARLALPIARAPRGGMFAAYVSPDAVLAIIKDPPSKSRSYG